MAVDAGGGTFASGWSGKPVDVMWAAVKDYNSEPHWKMVNAWKQSYELLLTHISQVKQYRENLATAWPPHKSKAAAAYVQQLDDLIENLEKTYDAAIANHKALQNATLAVVDARRELEPIQREHAANAILLTEYNAQKANTPTPSSSSSGVPQPSAGTAPTPPEPPVVPGRQFQLQQQAAGIMQSLGAELATAQTSFVSPPKYTGQDQGGTQGLPGGGGIGGSGGAGGSGLNPGFTPRGTTTPTGSSNIGTPTTTDRTVPDGKFDPSGPDGSTPSQGPTLVGNNPTTNPNVTNPGTPTPGGTSTLPPSNGTPGGGGGAFPFTPSTGVTPSGSGGGRFTPSGSAGGVPTGTSGLRGGSLPNNGVIGGSPMSGGGVPGGRAGQVGGGSGMPGGMGGPGGSGARGGTRGVNPSGGMIGGPGANSRGTTGRGVNGMGPGGMGGHPGRRANGRTDEDPQGRRWDPDNPWETDNGVDPVLLPAQEQRIDPGPSIGGR
ncbi:hypothetical protein [Actinoplanes couchii]|uniref:PPE family domain-containing protein n=1 Tax=Actinoplanes couchii TaxID=403638 RepID=A0ABQ3X6K0_9ACTN|nr:hypothetical protein [Actinoplanes couchii]MDR6325148.1 flagellar biosynthesis chaperone FliJ [Actinoplanes couchii]GID54145.1 hypothetical protein Aco03nite_025490 [Actinoplanes couchii]